MTDHDPTGSTSPRRQYLAPAGRWLRPRLAIVTVTAIVTVMGTLTAVISYSHESGLARLNGQSAWVARLVPASVDGIVMASSVVLLWAAWHGISGWGELWRPRLWAAVGMGATIAANLFSEQRFPWLGPAVSASCGVALVIISDQMFWLLHRQRPDAEPARPPAVTPCSCPPAPLTVADALPLARTALLEAGQPAGEQVLADRFGISRHAVRTHLAGEQPAPSLNGSSS